MKRIILAACFLLSLVACTPGSESESLLETSTAAVLRSTQQLAQLQTEYANTQTAAAPIPANTIRPTETSTNTVRSSNSPEPRNTAQVTNTPPPTEVTTDTYYIIVSTANIRACASSTTTCNVLSVMSYGDDIEVIETVDGVSVAGSTRWYHVLLNDGRDGYVHSSLISRTQPVAGSSEARPITSICSGFSVVSPVASAPPSVVAFQWTSVAQASEYRLRIYNKAGSVILDTITPETSLEVDLSIMPDGPDYEWEAEALANGQLLCLTNRIYFLRSPQSNVGGGNSGSHDRDSDGVTDSQDDCPSSPGPARNNGCPDQS